MKLRYLPEIIQVENPRASSTGGIIRSGGCWPEGQFLVKYFKHFKKHKQSKPSKHSIAFLVSSHDFSAPSQVQQPLEESNQNKLKVKLKGWIEDEINP